MNKQAYVDGSHRRGSHANSGQPRVSKRLVARAIHCFCFLIEAGSYTFVLFFIVEASTEFSHSSLVGVQDSKQDCLVIQSLQRKFARESNMS